MCNTGWKKVLERCGRTQRSTAQALNVNQAELSLVMQGRAFLTPEKFNKACELLGCRPTEVYGDDVLEVMYGRAKEQVRKRDRRVTIGEPQFSNVCKMADMNKCSKADVVNAILYAYLCKDEYQKIIEEAYEGFRKFREERGLKHEV